MSSRAPARPDLNAQVTVRQVIAELLELGWIDPNDIVDREDAQRLAERLSIVAAEPQLRLPLSA